MNVVLKIKNGYLNFDNGIVICKEENATVIPLSKVHSVKQEIYREKPMIGKIDVEVVSR